MKKMFRGVLFLLFSFNMKLEDSVFNLFPNFLGYYYLIQGFLELGQESEWFQKGIVLMQTMIPVSIIRYFLDVFGVIGDLNLYLVDMVSTGIKLYIMYICIHGVLDLEHTYFHELNGETLEQYWTILAAIHGVNLLLSLVGYNSMLVGVSIFALTILIVMKFKDTKNRYIKRKLL